VLSSARKYEIEALQIFTPDILHHLLDAQLKYDIELVDQELLFFSDGLIDTIDQLKTRYAQVADVFKLFAPKLDTFKFTSIGSFQSVLK
jgi:hypothetical protein